MSLTAALMASSASMLQCSLTGGRLRCLAMSRFLMVITSSMLLPLTHSVATLLLAMAEPHPKVLKQESVMLPLSSTLECETVTSHLRGSGLLFGRTNHWGFRVGRPGVLLIMPAPALTPMHVY